MSTLPGLTSKGEKGKSKFQSIDINSLYRSSRGESSEKQQQKSSYQLKHGMQSLGKVPSARRPPANLPSLKSEHSGNDTAVSLVPSGGVGWGKQDANSSTASTPSTTTTVTNSNVNTPTTPVTSQLNTHQAAVTLPVSSPIVTTNKHSPVAPATIDKSWSSVMSGTDLMHPPPYQSPQFQHEFPSLSAGDGGPQRPGTDTQYGPGPSLRPQTEGSWMQGGSRGAADCQPKNNSVPLGAPPQLSAPAGLPPAQPLPPQYRAFVPQFVYRGNNYSNAGHGNALNVANNIPPASVNGRNRGENRQRNTESEEIAPRPIIKEEDLNHMDDMRDLGWATHDDIDYNQKIAFSDDESESEIKKEKQLYKESEKTDTLQDNEQKAWMGSRNGSSSQDVRTRTRSTDEDEAIAQRRRQHNAEVATVVVRAKQRKEAEEKRYLESKKHAAKKLQELEEKIAKRDKEQDESQGTINPMSVPPQPITPSTIPVPEWEKEKDRTRNIPTEPTEEKPSKTGRENSTSDFRQLTQIEGRNFVRKDSRGYNREREVRDQSGSNYLKHFQSNMPPRFQKQQQQRNSSNSSPQPPTAFTHQYDSRWMQNNQVSNKTSPPNINRKPRDDSSNKERDVRRSDEYNRNNRTYPDSSHKLSEIRYKEEENAREFRHDTFDYKKDEEKWEKDKEKHERKLDSFEENNLSRQSSEEFHDKREKFIREDKTQERYERPQRPDSRDSRASRDSRHSRESVRESETRDYISSWVDNPLEATYEEKRKDHIKEDRRQVPGPITKDRIEADDFKSEKRNLTQLKRGHMPEKKNDTKQEDKAEKSNDDAWDIKKSKDTVEQKNWTDSSTHNAHVDTSVYNDVDVNKYVDSKENKAEDEKKNDKIQYDREKDDKRNQNSRNRSDMQSGNRNQGWGNNLGVVYRNSSSKRGSGRGSCLGPRPSSSKSGDWPGTDSEISADELTLSIESIKDDKLSRASARSPKPKKSENNEKNKDLKQDKTSDHRLEKQDNRKDYLPRGEPSRHGRGGGSNFRGRGGLSKRIDHYGPPPSKSPFSHSEDKDKKIDENTDTISSDEKNKVHQSSYGGRWKDTNQSLNRIERKTDDKMDKLKGRKSSDIRRGKSKNKDKLDDNDSASDNSEESLSKEKLRRQVGKLSPTSRVPSNSQPRRNNPPPRLANDKRNYGPLRNDLQNVKSTHSSAPLRSSQGIKKEENSICSAIADISLKSKENCEEIDNVECETEDKVSLQGDSDGFQEVKSKKNGKERQKLTDEKIIPKNNKIDKENKNERKGKSPSSQLSQQQIANIPALMATPINPPPIMPQNSNKNQRMSKLPPRFARQREHNRLQKQIQPNLCDVNDMNKVNQNMNMYSLKDGSATMPVPISNAWEKPLTQQLRNNIEQETILAVGIDNCKNIEQIQSPNQASPGNTDKVIGKAQDKAVLDGTSAPVNTIIFENTNFKSAPGSRNQRNDKARPNKLDDNNIENTVMSTFNKPISDLLNKSDKQSTESIMQLNFNKEDGPDMKLDFMESEISYLTDDKASKNLSLPRMLHTSSNNTISPSTTDALNDRIASVKKMWEIPTVMEHAVGQDDSSSFPPSFGPDPNNLDPSGPFSKGADAPVDNHEGYSPSPNHTAANSTTNVCKVKPTQQVAGSTGQTVLNTSAHQPHSAMVGGPGLMGHPLSPPPIQPVIGASVGLGQPPQQFTASQHIGYQASLGGTTQYGVSAIPSPPTVQFNSIPQIQAAQTGLYGPFQIDQSQVLGGQGRSQYSQYPNPYNLGQTASSPYSAQSMYLPTAQPHPPTAQAPDLYQSMSNYRLPATAPFGQNQQLNNPSTVLISSTSNSLMSATVKPSSQQISAIGTKAGGVGQAFHQQSTQGQQLYMYDPSLAHNYLPNTGVMQRGPAGPVQNNVVPGLQPSSSYYSGSTGGQTGYFQQPGSSTLQSGPLQQHQAGYGLQGNLFSTHNQSHTSAGMQNFNSHFLSAPMQIAAAAALNAQQYRSPNLPNTAYMKGISNQQLDQSSRSQQLKSPNSQQEVLSSVFNSGPQIPSPKSRQNCKQPPPQPSPTAQHKYNLYPNVGNQQSNQTQRYPTPIQRPVNYQPSLSSVQNNSNQKHRTNASRPPPRQYYTPQGGSLSSQTDKADDSKLSDSVPPIAANSANSSTASIVSKTSLGNSSTAVNQTSDITKEKEEASAMKD